MNSGLPRILAVDDNPRNLLVIGALLTSNNYEVDNAGSGQQALNMSETNDYDLILMDVIMPGMDGFETCTKIREIEKNRDIPLIFLTAKDDIASLKKGFSSGGVDYLPKPFNTDELVARVRTHIELKRLRDNQKEVNQWLEKMVAERTNELQKAYLTLESANRELQKLDHAKSEFLRMINHEIRTPLNALTGFIHILKKEALAPEITEMLSYLDIASARLEKFLMVVLQITELLAMEKPIFREMVPLGELLDTSVANNKPMAAMKEASIRVHIGKQGITIPGNRKLLQHCFDSILENALEYSGQKGTITLHYETSSTELFYEVRDDGKGFSDEALAALFKFFAVGDQHIDQKSGLSLALVKLIMDAHLGNVEVRNNKDKGATVRLTFHLGLSESQTDHPDIS
jgi:two-component system sensor histidine kinase/response regulator